MMDRRSFLKTLPGFAALIVGGSLLGQSEARTTEPSTPSYRTIGNQILDLESDFANSRGSYRVLDEIIETATQRIKPQESYTRDEAEAVLDQIDSILREKGFQYQKNGLLSHGLESKKIDCDNYSMIYLSIAELLRLPLKGVKAPRHVFIRWDDGAINFNWETTSLERRKERDDEHYKKDFKISQEAIQRGIYLKSLTRDQLIGCAYEAIGLHLCGKKRDDDAIVFYRKGLALDPVDTELMSNIGNAYQGKKDHEEAIKWYEKAIGLDTTNAIFHINMATAFHNRGQYDTAIEWANKAIKLDSGNPIFYEIRAQSYEDKGWSGMAMLDRSWAEIIRNRETNRHNLR